MNATATVNVQNKGVCHFKQRPKTKKNNGKIPFPGHIPNPNPNYNTKP